MERARAYVQTSSHISRFLTAGEQDEYNRLAPDGRRLPLPRRSGCRRVLKGIKCDLKRAFDSWLLDLSPLLTPIHSATTAIATVLHAAFDGSGAEGQLDQVHQVQSITTCITIDS